MKILALCDSFAVRADQAITGFGRVNLNLFSRWSQLVPDLQLHIWAIGFDGHGYKAFAEKYPNWTFIPGGGQNWNSPERLKLFLRQLASGNYTHVFILMDPDAVSVGDFPATLREICRQKKIKSVLYYPVDAPLQPPFEIISAVDVAVTFTDYGAQQTEKHFRFRTRAGGGLHVIPHGIDSQFKPLTVAERERYRNQFQVMDGKQQKPFVTANDFLIVNVNKNEWRKDPLRSLEILKGLRDAGVPAKLVMRMAPTSFMGGVHLERAAEQLGLKLDREWAHIPPVVEEHLPGLYGSADLYLSTSIGEGWGLGVTEALGCGTPVAIPNHTSLAEIGERVIGAGASSPTVKLLELEKDFVCGYDTRLRRRVNVEYAVKDIAEIYRESKRATTRGILSPEIMHWLSWDRVAAEFLKLLEVK